MLLVEDDADARALISRVIRRKYPGLKLWIADNGRAGLDLFRSHGADVVLTDINMPQLDGMAMAREIRQVAVDTAIIAITARGNPDTSGENGTVMDHYLGKPLVYQKLFTVLDASIARILAHRKRA